MVSGPGVDGVEQPLELDVGEAALVGQRPGELGDSGVGDAGESPGELHAFVLEGVEVDGGPLGGSDELEGGQAASPDDVVDTTLALVSRAPVASIERFKERMGWQVPWYSSYGSEFNYGFHVSFGEERARLEYNDKDRETLRREAPYLRSGADGPGVSVCVREGDRDGAGAPGRPARPGARRQHRPGGVVRCCVPCRGPRGPTAPGSPGNDPVSARQAAMSAAMAAMVSATLG